MKFAFIRDHLAGDFSIVDCCRVLRVSQSGYYRWRRTPVGRREQRRIEIVRAIREVHEENRRVYAGPRITKALAHRRIVANRKTVASRMREHGIRARVPRLFRPRTTDSSHGHPAAPNLLNRAFRVDEINAVWLADITYIPTGEGFLYLAGAMDLCSRRIVGWSMADHLRAEVAIDAMRMALEARRPGAGLVHHSDRGEQSACAVFRELLARHGVTASMSAAGDCLDNAPKESFWATLTSELMAEPRFERRDEARQALFEWIEVFYNRTRMHSSLDYLNPERFEASVSC